MSDGLLGGLSGIDDAKEIHIRDETVLEKLLEIEERLIKKAMEEPWHKRSIENDEQYYPLYHRLKDVELNEVRFDEEHLREFILAKSNNDYSYSHSMALGIYTSCLLHILTERNEIQGKRTVFYVNGNGNEFNFLFFNLHLFDTLVVYNFVGDHICRDINNYSEYKEERYSRVVCAKIRGDYTLAKFISKGIEQLIAIDVNGDYTFREGKGCVNQIIGVNLKGSFVLLDIQEGWFNQIIGVDIEGRGNMCGLVRKAMFAQILGVGIKGHSAFSGIGGDISKSGLQTFFSPTKVIGINIEGEYSFRDIKYLDYSLDYVVSDKTPESEVRSTIKAKHLIFAEENREEYQRMLREEKVEETVALVRSFIGMPYQEVLKIADELYALRPKVPESFFENK